MAEARDTRDYPPVLDAAQVAELLQLHIDSVRKLSREGVLPAHRLPGGRAFRYLKDEILDWLRAQAAHAGPARGEVSEAAAPADASSAVVGDALTADESASRPRA